MRKLERAQREMRTAVRDGGIELGTALPVAAQAVLQRELHHNARQLTHMHIALAFCRNRRRRSRGHVADTVLHGVAYWIGILSKGCGWSNPDAVHARCDEWLKWCDGAGPEPVALAWQREFLRRERKLRQARRAARKAAQGRVLTVVQTEAGPDVAIIPADEIAIQPRQPMTLETIAKLFPEPQP